MSSSSTSKVNMITFCLINNTKNWHQNKTVITNLCSVYNTQGFPFRNSQSICKGYITNLKIIRALSFNSTLPEPAQSNKNFSISGHVLFPSSSANSTDACIHQIKKEKGYIVKNHKCEKSEHLCL